PRPDPSHQLVPQSGGTRRAKRHEVPPSTRLLTIEPPGRAREGQRPLSCGGFNLHRSILHETNPSKFTSTRNCPIDILTQCVKIHSDRRLMSAGAESSPCSH